MWYKKLFSLFNWVWLGIDSSTQIKALDSWRLDGMEPLPKRLNFPWEWGWRTRSKTTPEAFNLSRILILSCSPPILVNDIRRTNFILYNALRRSKTTPEAFNNYSKNNIKNTNKKLIFEKITSEKCVCVYIYNYYIIKL
jgi:hypothetical protein